MGRVTPEKRFDLIGAVGPQLPDAKFVLMGGADATGLKIVSHIKQCFKKAGLKDNFIYMGRVSTLAKREILMRAKVLFHPSPYESFGIVLVEAMAAGTIPIAHNSGAPTEFIKDDYLFTNVEEAVEKIRNALNEGISTREEMRRISYKFSEERFKKEIINVVDYLISIR